ncbi:hypothetical protein NESM_000470900 [Novymonas esmeraldas]|uniref:Uncharacterized protein n=1 Tax=Novymonas esmeraldas TaxID=1808958 RepID=A0AAW0EN04_9TRYP
MRPPRTVYSVVFRNHTSDDVIVFVTYKSVSGLKTRTRVRVPANGSATAEERTYTLGTATLVMEIANIKLRPPGPLQRRVGASKLKAPFPGVEGPTKEYNVDIVGSGPDRRFTINPA